jgi:hypothetical protein
MDRNISMIFTFIAGVAVGIVATHKIAEQKYRNIADEEIESVVERFSNREPTVIQNKVKVEDDKGKIADERALTPKTNILEYKSNVDRFGYDKINKDNIRPNQDDKTKGKEVEDMQKLNDNNPSIYVITPDEFNTLDGFETATLYYSSDNYVLDSDYHVLPDSVISRTIGHDPYGHFGEYEEDSVYIRNEELMCDYEILLSMKTCDEIRED